MYNSEKLKILFKANFRFMFDFLLAPLKALNQNALKTCNNDCRNQQAKGRRKAYFSIKCHKSEKKCNVKN